MRSRQAKSFLFWTLTFWVLVQVLLAPAFAQDGPTPTAVATETPSATPTLPSVSEMMVNVESTRDLLVKVDARWQQDATIQEVDGRLSAFAQQVEKESEELNSQLALGPTMEELASLELRWQSLAASVKDWKTQMNTYATGLDRDMDQLSGFITSWNQALTTQGPVPLAQDLRSNIDLALTQLRAALGKAESRRGELLGLLARLGSQDARLRQGLESIRVARAALLNEFLVNERPPVWAIDWQQLRSSEFEAETSNCLSKHRLEFLTYAGQYGNRFLLEGLAFGLFYLLVGWARPQVKVWVGGEPALAAPARIFQSQTASALLLAVLVGRWMHVDAPPSVRVLQAVLALVPGLVLLHRISPYSIRRGLFLLGLLFLADLARLLLVPCILLHRLIFTLEVTFAFVYILAGFLSSRKLSGVPSWHQFLRGLALVLIAGSWLAVNLGFVRLAYLLGNATLRSFYMGALLVCLVQIVNGLVLFGLRSRPLCHLPSVRNFGGLYLQRLGRFAVVLAAAFWAYTLLDQVGLLPWLTSLTEQILQWGIHFRALHVTLGGILIVAISLWLPYHISRFVRFLLQEDVYIHLNLTRGEAYTLSTLVHYALLSAGLLAGMLAVGLDMTKFTVVAGALSVGVGFGLQSIVNNLVSGLILLIERPIQVGDSVEVSGQEGTLEKVGIRASVLRTIEGSEIIVPNGDLLSKQVTNWTFSDQRRCLCIVVKVAYGTSPDLVQKLLLAVASEHPAVAVEPPPMVIFQELVQNALQFELRAWTERFSTWTLTRSDLVRATCIALQEANIQLPTET